MTNRPKSHVHLLLVDDHPAVRESLALFLEGEGIAVCAQTGARAEALQYVETNALDLALVDLSLGGGEGLSLIADLHARGIPVIVCSSQEGLGSVHRALAAGARAYIAKREAGAVLAQVIRDVLAGWVVVSPKAGEDS